MTKRPAIILRKTAQGIVPASAYDAEEWDALPLNAEVDAKPRSKRSNPQNRLYWQVLTNVVANTWLGDRYPVKQKLHRALLREIGMVEVAFDLDGTPRVEVDSTAFDAMPADEFRAYFDKAMARLSELVGADVLTDPERRRAA